MIVLTISCYTEISFDIESLKENKATFYQFLLNTFYIMLWDLVISWHSVGLRGYYAIYVNVMGSTRLLRGARGNLLVSAAYQES